MDQHIMIKGTIYQGDIIVINIYASKIGAPKYKAIINRPKGRS